MRRVFAALAAAALAVACGDSQKSEAPAPAATPAPAPPAPPAPAPAPSPAPATPATAGVPSGNLRGDAANGAKLYAQYCASCHGPKGDGDGPVAATLNPRPAKHHDHVFMATLSDQHLYQVISKGGASVGKSPMMAPWGGVIPEQGIKDLIAFLRELSNT